jgi:DNA-binding IclR family transcriptional regulator
VISISALAVRIGRERAVKLGKRVKDAALRLSQSFRA